MFVAFDHVGVKMVTIYSNCVVQTICNGLNGSVVAIKIISLRIYRMKKKNNNSRQVVINIMRGIVKRVQTNRFYDFSSYIIVTCVMSFYDKLYFI